MSEERVFIEVNQQVSLEGGLSLPDAPRGAALVLHPHPLYGGSMHNNVVLALVQGAEKAGWAALRVNFRGVGRSTGRHDEGRGEQEDVIAAAAWLRERVPGPLALMGYSFGCLTGARAAERVEGLSGGVWVSPPYTLGDLPPWPQGAGPLLIMCGDADEYGDTAKLKAFDQAMGARSTLMLTPGGDHFWLGGESALTRESTRLLQRINELDS
ncbi:MAG: alpha/beta fold hydrolase [Desulfarculaceae bacterium]|nr:alpha/beta fold hydrolase [Desulfarculaceae bacterium]